jgi:hypothetical protein
MEPLIELRCGDCGVLFHLCTRCYRGQRYCDDGCRRPARRRQRRDANRRHRNSPEGRLDARDRKRRQRDLARARIASVTDQGSPTPGSSHSVPTSSPTLQPEPQVASTAKEPTANVSPDCPSLPPVRPVPQLRCRRCERASAWILVRVRRGDRRTPSRAPP